MKESMAYKKNPAEMTALWERCKNKVFSLKDNEKSLGFPGKVLKSRIRQSRSYSTR